jgi:hypothetical protein
MRTTVDHRKPWKEVRLAGGLRRTFRMGGAPGLTKGHAARSMPPTVASLQGWLAALTDYCQALSDIQRLNNESIHEKLHAIAGPLKVEHVL